MRRILFVLIIILTFGLVIFYLYQKPKEKIEDQSATTPQPIQAQSDSQKEYPITASFEIYTNGLKRDFSANMYHEISEKAYIENKKPYNIVVNKPKTTWQEFFDSLPFKLTKDCLTTGTGQTFCSTETQMLRFYLNGIENSNLLDLEITNEDVTVIRYE